MPALLGTCRHWAGGLALGLAVHSAILAFGRQRQEQFQEFKACLGYTANDRSARPAMTKETEDLGRWLRVKALTTQA